MDEVTKEVEAMSRKELTELGLEIAKSLKEPLEVAVVKRLAEELETAESAILFAESYQ
jgi:hypothetical protein